MSLPESAPAGVIHDIGYRGYDGARLGRRSIRFALFAHSLRGVYGLGRSGRSKIIPFGMAGVMLLPAVIIAAVTVAQAGANLSEPIVPFTRYASILSAAIAIFVAVQGPQTVSLDMRFQSLPLYLSRPLTRTDYVVAKVAGLTAGLFLLIAAPILVLYVGALFAELPAGPQTADVALALVGAALFALVIGGVALLIASLTPRRGFGIAAIVTVLALSFAMVAALQGSIGFGMGDEQLAGWMGLFSPFTLVDGVQVWAFGADTSATFGPPGGAGPVFLLVALASIAACYAGLALRYRKVTL